MKRFFHNLFKGVSSIFDIFSTKGKKRFSWHDKNGPVNILERLIKKEGGEKYIEN